MSEAKADYTVFLPVVHKPKPERKLPKPPKIGVQIEGSAVNQARWLGDYGAVKLRAPWYQVSWADLDAQVSAIQGRPLILQIFGTPEAYRIDKSAICSPPTREYLPNLVDFAHELARRYNPLALEVWNEPETPADVAKSAGVDHLFGGFGPDLAEYYGKCVKKIGKMLRKHGYSTWLLGGALALSDSSLRFWSKARQVCAGWFDAVSFHSYSTYPGGRFDFIEVKARMLRSLPGAQDDILWVTETALTAYEDTKAFREAQAKYLDYVAANLKAWRVKSLTWYPLANNGWRGTDLVRSGIPMPAWYRYQELTKVP